jgi:hypothetical protein
MPLSDTLTFPANAWAQLTANDITALTFQVQRGDVMIEATAGAVAPTNLKGALRYKQGQGELGVTLAAMFPGVAGANRVYVYPLNGDAQLAVSHA